MIYQVHFNALVFKPFKGEVLDGYVSGIDNQGFMVKSGPLECFISTMVGYKLIYLKHLSLIQRIEKEFEYDTTQNVFISKRDINIKIKLDSEIRYKIDQIKYDKGHYVSYYML